MVAHRSFNLSGRSFGGVRRDCKELLGRAIHDRGERGYTGADIEPAIALPCVILLRRGGRGVRPYTCVIAAVAVVLAFGFRAGLRADLCAEPHRERWACA